MGLPGYIQHTQLAARLLPCGPFGTIFCILHWTNRTVIDKYRYYIRDPIIEFVQEYS